MAMDFFGAQDEARKRTKQLIALYFAAMLTIIVCIYLVFALAGFGGGTGLENQSSAYRSGENASERTIELIDPGLFAMVAGGVILIIAGASLFKIMSLGKGGAAIAKSVGGRQIDMSTSDPDERKLMNLVEEMSIASGTPMPDVFILENESGINAFAAGSDINDAAVAVTKGAIRELSRDELQGVIAHEFSHIFSGDMRLNIRLIGPLFGLLVIAFIGRMFLYSGSGRSRGKDQGGLALVGLAVMAIGYIGVIFGRLIQAAISRQREYLADASAVQFTRNPEGIGNALRRLGYTQGGSKIAHAHAEDTAHMFFAQALGSSLATHPPLPKRIRAVMPNWDGSFLPPRKENFRDEAPKPNPAKKSFEGGGMNAAAAIAAVGALHDDHLREGIESRIRIRRQLGDVAFDDPREARATFAGLILSPDEESREDQLRILEESTKSEFAKAVRERGESVEGLAASDRFAVMELCCPGLRKLVRKDQEEFADLLRKLAEADGKISLREALVLEVIRRQLDRTPSRGKSQRLEKDVAKLSRPISGLLYLVADLDSDDPTISTQRFEDAVSPQSLLSGAIHAPSSAPAISDLTKILAELNGASFGIRKQVISAAADIVLMDRKTSDREWTFLRLVSLALGAPMPPLAGY